MQDCSISIANSLKLLQSEPSLYSTSQHYNDVIMSAMASQITSLTIVYSIVYSGADQRKHQSSASLVFVRGIHRWPVNSPHKGPATRKMFPFDDVIMRFMDMVCTLLWFVLVWKYTFHYYLTITEATYNHTMCGKGKTLRCSCVRCAV